MVQTRTLLRIVGKVLTSAGFLFMLVGMYLIGYANERASSAN